ncbi:MAG: efflux RND transporter periplasmic adaptor subunit [Gemmatimonadota bacterium]|nr:efflux RND transporter periplasmic adaptor subunit [Gemmatimonadota bacterium]
MAATLGACSVQVGGQDEGDGADSAAQADSTAADSLSKPIEAIPVEVALAHTGEISAHLVFNSTIETEAAVEIYPQISGLVKHLKVEEGDRVEVGDTLLSIEDKQLRIAVEEAQANYHYQQTAFKRTEAMFERNLISDQEFETNKYNFEQARLRLERARLELEYAEVIAPFSGVITERHVQVGARVGPSSKLYDLIKLDDLIARVFAPGQYLTTIGNGQQALITSEFLPDKQFQAWVKRISPVVDPRSGTFKVTVGLRDRWEYLRPGLFVNVRIITDTHTNAVLIPKQAIVYDGGDRFVFAVVDTTAARIKLQPGFEDTDFIESLAGIESGTPIIVVGQNGLKDSTRVRIVNSADDGSAELAEDASQG